MISEVFSFYYNSSKGLTEHNGVKLSTQSPQGTIKLTREGPEQQLNAQIKEIKQDLIQNPSDTRRCHELHCKIFYEAIELLGGKIQGSQEDKQHFLKEYGLENDIRDLTEVLHDDCGGQIWTIAYFRDNKFYYRLEIVRTWPGYEY